MRPVRVWYGTPYYERLVADPGWIVEPKFDGDRCLAFVLESGVELWSRHGRPHGYAWLGPLSDALRGLPVGTVLDGELLASPAPRAEYAVFDLASEYALPLAQRRRLLERLLRRQREGVTVVPWLEGRATAYAAALGEGHEGVVFKRLSSVYQWQRSTTAESASWCKARKL
jgi:ATP-dependent DNA ligase